MATAKKNYVKSVAAEIIVNKIFVIREHKVMLDYDVAFLYGVSTKRMNEQVKRNIEKFSGEFMFRLNKKEWLSMRSQIATASQNKRNINVTPYAFTEHGVQWWQQFLKAIAQSK